MDKEIITTIANYIRIIREKYTDIEKAYLFGSYAKGKANQDSDIDLALIFKNMDNSKRFDIQVQLMLIASQIDSRIEPHPISHDDFYSGNSFVSEIQKTGLEISTEAT